MARYSGEWEDNFNRRAKRVEQILQFTERTFNPDMLAKGENPSVSLNIGKGSVGGFGRQFGSAMIRKVTDISRFDAETMQAPTTTISVPAKFVETFLAVAHFCIKEDPLSNVRSQRIGSRRFGEWSKMEQPGTRNTSKLSGIG